ncbi:penicillin-binding transpeptidase domain-containing protein [Conexibacter arvalis]|uniref:Peptidoglycan glycosyltransferase n=1 Tax=Conexibacter arvalis TaxID=912552 RepID=A0A840IBK8_9ACTN|nr:penicillin-binding transpeptidase domain-containing protein [Conexibacter arvalis]MBB4661448.1 peptidoglycan glycosyltransferase [Conexibacter arvalis]
MLRRLPHALLLLLATVALAACGGGSAPDDDRVERPAPTVTDPDAPPPAPALDAAAQRAARHALAGRRGGVAALDLRDGRIVVLTGSGGGSATRDAVPPGSTLKTLLGGLALEEGLIDADGPLDGDMPAAPGADNYRGVRLGPLTLAQALAHSSNTAFSHVAVALGAARIEAGLRRGGWGSPVEVDLPPTRLAASVANVAEPIGPDGRYVDVDELQRTTVLQLALLAAAVAGDGTVPRPWLAQRPPRASGGRLWRAAVARELRRGLRLAVTDGTGAAMDDPRLAIAGKTGTVRLPDGAIQASTIAFAPFARPRWALAVSLRANPDQTGGTAAAPIAREVLKALAG